MIQGITSVIQALPPAEAVGPVAGILTPIVDRLDAAQDPAALVQCMHALVACFKGLSPSEDDIFEEGVDTEAIARARPLVQPLRQRIEQSVTNVVAGWNGDGEVADVSSAVARPVLTCRQYLRSSSTRRSQIRSFHSRRCLCCRSYAPRPSAVQGHCGCRSPRL